MTDELMVVAEEEEFLLSENQKLERNDDEGLEMTTVTTMMDVDFSQNPKTCGKDELIMKVYDPNEQEIEVMKEAHELGEEEKDKEETIEKDDAEVGETVEQEKVEEVEKSVEQEVETEQSPDVVKIASSYLNQTSFGLSEDEDANNEDKNEKKEEDKEWW
ncbi:hypothetical protein L6452_17056 [Arctium lappa]|uniref:Uncharacterized protein n=1 Tax=Arctium lappa TaxID=4217 RepID=A0ACB9C2B3_ARCLA|nr:hypothetical protein L6452_17056 [Arctium lappa]